MIPDYQTLMLPLLQALEDGREHKKQNLIEHLAAKLQVSVEERAQLLPSRTQHTFDNRVGWAITYLKKAKLVSAQERATFRITDRGRQVLTSGPARIDNRYLRQFREFVEFKTRPTVSETISHAELTASQLPTPEEILRQSYQEITSALADDLLDRVRKCSPSFFERLVVQLLVKLGYGGTEADAAQAVGKSGDGGIDGTIKEDPLGLDIVYIQAKRYGDGNTVGRPAIQQFVGALSGKYANKGVFITTSSFSPDARSFASAITQKVILIDGEQLARLMIRTGVGVTTTETLELKRIDSDYFEEE